MAWKKRSSQLASSCTTQLTSPVNIPHLLHNISDKLSPTINRSPAKFQISSSEISSANSPSSSPRLQDSHSSQVPQPSSPHQSLTQVYQSNGTFTSTLKLPTSTDATTPSSPPQFPFDTHPPNTSSSDTGMSSIPSCNLSIQISDTFIPSSSTTLSLPSQSDPLPSTAFHATSSTSSQWETKPVKNDKKKVRTIYIFIQVNVHTKRFYIHTLRKKFPVSIHPWDLPNILRELGLSVCPLLVWGRIWK